MSQFVLIVSAQELRIPSGIHLRPIRDHEEFLRTIAYELFERTTECRVVMGDSGGVESLLDDVWEAQNHGEPLDSLPFVTLLSEVVDRDAELVAWCGSEYRDLPLAHTHEELMNHLRAQTALQPAEFYVRYRPSQKCSSE